MLPGAHGDVPSPRARATATLTHEGMYFVGLFKNALAYYRPINSRLFSRLCAKLVAGIRTFLT